MTTGYEKGENLMLRVNGAVLGGVSELRRTEKCQWDGIYTYLTDKPVAKIPSKKYYIEITLCRGEDYPFDGTVDSLSISDGERTETYSMCSVEKAESRAGARGEVVYTVTVAAEERSIAYG